MNLTDLFEADTELQLARGLTQKFAATLVAADATRTGLDVTGGTVSWDENRAPRVAADLTLALPEDLDTIAALDPRTGARVQLVAGYLRPGGDVDAAQVADLGLRRREVTRDGNAPAALNLSARSDEALAIDGAPTFAGSISTTTTTLGITAALNAAMEPNPNVAVSVPAELAAVALADITDWWTTADDLADQLNADLYDDGTRVWHLEPRPVLAAMSAATLRTGPAGLIARSAAVLERDDWANRVRIRYTWRDAGNVDHIVYGQATVTGGPFDPTGPAGYRVMTIDRATPTTQAAANAAAAAVLARQLARSRSYLLRAPAMWWLRPGDTVTVQLPTGGQERHIVSSVTFEPAAGMMSLTTRLPDNSSAIGA